MHREVESAIDWAFIGLFSWLVVTAYLSSKLLREYLGKPIVGPSVYWFTLGLTAFLIAPLALAILMYFTWIRPLQRNRKPNGLWQILLIIFGIVLYLLPGLVLIIARRKLASIPSWVKSE